MVSDNFVGALAILLIFGAPITAWIVSRVLAHQERIEMIRRGMVPPPGPMPGFGSKMPPPVWAPPPGTVPPPNAGKRGAYPGYPGYDEYYYAQSQMRKGIRLTLIGFALLIGLGTIGPLSGMSYFGPWLLGGLIPMFVGIAQIANAAVNGAQVPGFGAYRGQPHYGPPPPPPPGMGAPPQAPPAGPYAWRPGPTPEIERPEK